VIGGKRNHERIAVALGRKGGARSGSRMISASMPMAASCSAARKRYCALVMTIGRPNGCDTRRIVSWNVDSGPNSGRNCLGRPSRDAGHSRVPAPPHMIKGTIDLAKVRLFRSKAAQNQENQDVPRSGGWRAHKPQDSKCRLAASISSAAARVRRPHRAS
jgi:hypothetical protein